jgi:hypothetical protein
MFIALEYDTDHTSECFVYSSRGEKSLLIREIENVTIEILVEPYYLTKLGMDLLIALGCAFMLIGPCFKICWLKKFPDKSAEFSH